MVPLVKKKIKKEELSVFSKHTRFTALTYHLVLETDIYEVEGHSGYTNMWTKTWKK